LDIRDNKISADLADLISVLRMNCPMLKKLWIARSTKGKDTQKPKEYLNQVFSQMLELDLLDNFPHPGRPAAAGLTPSTPCATCAKSERTRS
jgi:hypothetical protein